MRASYWRGNVATGLVGLALGMAIASSQVLVAQVPPGRGDVGEPRAQETYFAPSPPDRSLDANLYMQTAAEYRACCYQAFNFATAVLRDRLRNRRADAKPSAIILDLDETVFDNSGFQAMLLRSGLTYDRRLWRDWQQNLQGRLALVPGAREFILTATQADVSVFYIGNTREEHREAIEAAMRGFVIPVPTKKNLLLRDDRDLNPDDKTKRRESVTSGHDVLVSVGDNLRDFDETFAFVPVPTKSDPADQVDAAIDRRKRLVDAKRDYFGGYYIILPNPVYGEWMKPMNRGERDEDRLVMPRP